MATRGSFFVPAVPPSAPTPRRSFFTPPPDELSRFLTLPREPESPTYDSQGKPFYMELDWADQSAPSSDR
jgi:hypothetical protein